MKMLELIVNRKQLSIPVDQVLYAEISDKLCKIYLTNKEVLNIFISMHELEEKLGEENCIRISRSCLVVKSAISKIRQNYVYLIDGNILTVSHRRKNEIMKSYQKHVDERIPAVTEDHMDTEDFQKAFGWWDYVPYAFAVLEMVLDGDGQVVDFIFRYVNEALSSVEGIPAEKMLNQTFGSLFHSAQKRWNSMYAQVAFGGKRLQFIQFSPEVNKNLNVLCYQPSYGYCACIITEVEETEKIYERKEGQRT